MTINKYEVELAYHDGIILTLPCGAKVKIVHGGFNAVLNEIKIAIAAPPEVKINRPDARNHNERTDRKRNRHRG